MQYAMYCFRVVQLTIGSQPNLIDKVFYESRVRDCAPGINPNKLHSKSKRPRTSLSGNKQRSLDSRPFKELIMEDLVLISTMNFIHCYYRISGNSIGPVG